MTTRIVLPVDGSPSAQRALELVAGYQGAKDALYVFAINVQSPVAISYPEAAVIAPSIESSQREAGQQIADAAAARLRAGGITAESVVRLGLPASAIAEEGLARRGSLIVMGTRGHGVVRGFALGSVALRLAHGSSVPVCIVQPDARLPGAFGRRLRVLLAVDGSAPAIHAAQVLAEWRPWLGELDVQIAYVQPPLSLAKEILSSADDLLERWSTREGEEAARAEREIFARDGVKHHLHLTIGDADAEIVHLANHLGCEMIALGTRGRGAAHHAFVGSVALKVAATSPVPVLMSR